MINYLKSKIVQFSLVPNIFCIFEPFYFARYNLKNIKFLSDNIYGKTLDVGCAKPYKKMFKNSSNYIGIEIETELQKKKIADYFYDGKSLLRMKVLTLL